jgi:copper chaperone
LFLFLFLFLFPFPFYCIDKGNLMISFQVPDMTCGHCVKTITAAVLALDSSAAVSCDVDTKKVSVDSVADAAKVEEVIRDAGYSPVKN